MSSDLQTAIQDLRDALSDEDAGNDRVRDCAFEVVDAHARATAAPAPPVPAARCECCEREIERARSAAGARQEQQP